MCERNFVEYVDDRDVIRRFPDIQCRFLNINARVVHQRRKEELEDIKNRKVFEPSPKQLRNYKELFRNYNLISVEKFGDCFSEQPYVYEYFAQMLHNQNEPLPAFLHAVNDPQISAEVREKIKDYIVVLKESAHAAEIQKFFEHEFVDEEGNPYTLDDEQALTLAVQNQRVLAVARAGSGKTRVIVAKIAYLVRHEHVSADQIFPLAFNRNVPIEINSRVILYINGGRTAISSAVNPFHGKAAKIGQQVCLFYT